MALAPGHYPHVEHDDDGHHGDDRHRDRRPKWPVARIEELLADQVADVDGLVAAEDYRVDVFAEHRDEDEQRARHDPRRGERPRSCAASTSDQSIRSSAAYTGRTISGR